LEILLKIKKDFKLYEITDGYYCLSKMLIDEAFFIVPQPLHYLKYCFPPALPDTNEDMDLDGNLREIISMEKEYMDLIKELEPVINQYVHFDLDSVK
jgi:hypothetical protein